jgi:hypothetical protein
VEFTYTPLAFWGGALVSGAAFLAVLAAGLFKGLGLFKRREKIAPPEGHTG